MYSVTTFAVGGSSGLEVMVSFIIVPGGRNSFSEAGVWNTPSFLPEIERRLDSLFANDRVRTRRFDLSRLHALREHHITGDRQPVA